LSNLNVKAALNDYGIFHLKFPCPKPDNSFFHEMGISSGNECMVANSSNTVLPHIVSSHEHFPPLNTFLNPVRKLFNFSLHKEKINAETI
jgi:hypothetical protein